MQAKDIMTSNVTWVAPDASVLDVAELLVAKRISAVPVIENDALVGIVSEASLMHRQEIGSERDPRDHPWWIRVFKGEQSPVAYVESHAVKVADIMTAPVITVTEDTPVSELASLFDRQRIKRVPVVRGKSVIGIVSRADLVKALAKSHIRRELRSTSDEAIRNAVRLELESQPWWRREVCDVDVAEGVVHFSGLLDFADEAEAARVAAENVPGVRGVKYDLPPIRTPAFGYW